MANRRRAEARHPERMLVSGGVVTESGIVQEVFTASLTRPMPDKVPGQHRWIATTVFTVSADEILQQGRGEGPMMMDRENLLDVMFGCWDCEEPFSERLAGQPCRAAASPWHTR